MDSADIGVVETWDEVDQLLAWAKVGDDADLIFWGRPGSLGLTVGGG
ncbi:MULTISPECIES: hypothetical protein [Streptacidiphilus]|uniref:Uncharacterized protein n=1 Tax=Streptacidiphilus cavernicola TaxID=3342716 RepID=A0ABV6V145_9ACTN|nr:hypothetical protein [Streptacidiphilus jeojiense]